jgi:hypothetical protein
LTNAEKAFNYRNGSYSNRRRINKLVILLLVLIFVGLTVPPFLYVKANPFVYYARAPAPANINPPIIISSLKENASYSKDGTITVCLNVTGPEGPNLLTKYVEKIDYKGDWMQVAENVYRSENMTSIDDLPNFLQINFNITGIPFGEHSLNVTAIGGGSYIKDSNYNLRYVFTINSSSSVTFVGRINPIISFLSSGNITFKDSAFPLNFTVDHPVLEIAYSIDGKENVPIDGNTTLTGLANGQHNITLYATDELGHTGVSDTLFFNVDAQEFSMVPLFVVSVIAIVLAAVGLLVYNNKRKRS